VADTILYSAEKAPREIVAGGAGKGMLLTQRLSPRLMDAKWCEVVSALR